VQLCAFDLLAEGGEDLRKVPLHLRKASLKRLLARRPEGVFVNPFERGEVGPDLFRAACDMGLEGLLITGKTNSPGLPGLDIFVPDRLSYPPVARVGISRR
jgi:ATP-dependent DNA ligase